MGSGILRDQLRLNQSLATSLQSRRGLSHKIQRRQGNETQPRPQRSLLPALRSGVGRVGENPGNEVERDRQNNNK